MIARSLLSLRASVAAVVLLFAFAQADSCYPVPSSFKTLARSGQPASAQFPLGAAMNYKGQNIMTTKGGSTKLISNAPDYTTIIKTKGQIYMITQFEAPNPSSMYMVRLTQNSDDGELTMQGDPIPIDTSSAAGLWNMCAGSRSPWNTHIGGEEYEPDAKAFEQATCLYNSTCGSSSLEILDADSFSGIIEFIRYFDIYATESTPIAEVKAVFNPYRYGFSDQVDPLGDNKYTYTKIYISGRSSKELITFMPDNKTAYITDDGERTAFFKLVLDRPADLSSGTLYIAKMTQTSADNGGSFNIKWIPLGSATNDDIKKLAMSDIKFSDIFDSVKPVNGSCSSGYTSINAGGPGLQCLKVKPGMEKAAAFLETRRYGAMLGGTTEFSKWEGLAFAPSRMTAYTSISEVRRGMEDNKDKGKDSTKYDGGSNNDIRVTYNPCGCVYSLAVDSNYNIYNMVAYICGVPVKGDDKNTCSLDGIANPDNIAIIDDQDVLLIGEDTGSGHRNDALYAVNLNNNKLERILTSPYGSEVTGVTYFRSIGIWNYLTAVIQHPYGESDEDQADLSKNPYYKGMEGYIGYYAMPSWLMKNTYLDFSTIGVPTSQKDQSDVLSSTVITICNKKTAGRKLI